MREFDTDTIRVIAAFENITRTAVRDCLRKDIIYFLVEEGRVAKTIGKGGQTIKTAERMLGKAIKVFEWDEDVRKFVNNLIPKAKKIEIDGSKATVMLDSRDRGMVLGKAGCNVKAIREFLERNSNIKDLKIV